MGEITRLSFVKSTVGAAAGFSVIGSIVAEKADASTVPAGTASVVAYVKDPSTGEISVMSGDHEVVVQDFKLAAQLSRAAG